MLSLRIGLAPSLAIAVMLLPVVVASAKPARAQAPANTPTGTLPVTQLKVTSNLVVVRVVVRDAQGKPVMGLRKEDFRLFDSGKQQPITQFQVEPGVEPSSPPASPSMGSHGLPPAAPATPTALPGRFLALYFDDLFTSDSDIPQVRQAARDYLAANLQPTDRVAIFTSGQMLSDFTSDPKHIQDALSRLKASPGALTHGHDCPELSDYQAQEMINTQGKLDLGNPWNTSDAWGLAWEDAGARNCLTGIPAADKNYLLGKATAFLGQTEILTRSNLRELEQVVKYTSQMPGQRIVIFASPGFLLQSENQFQLEGLIDQALRLQVVISSLDPRGLVVLARQADASQLYIPSHGRSAGAMHRMDQNREVVAQDVLAQLAEGTGGEFFHNNNDLKAGFGRLSGSGSYILAFAPKDLKMDGKLHSLKVTLAEKGAGYSIQARRGYYAPRNEAEAKAWAAEAETTGPAGQPQEQIREALLSKADIAQFPVVLDAKVTEGQGETHKLSLLSHVDPKSLHFQKEAGHNRNTLTFVFGVFDQKGNLVTAQQRHATVDVTDAQLSAFLEAGMDLGMNFELKPGNYSIREVVTDSDQRQSALSRNIDIPNVIPATMAASAPPPHPPQAPGPQPGAQPNSHASQPAAEASNVSPPSPGKISTAASPAQAPIQQPVTTSAADPATRKVLLQVWGNFVQYLSSIPNIFADEHVISSLTMAQGSQVRARDDDNEMQSVTDSTIDSVFQLKRVSNDGKTADLVESREIKYVDHQVAAKGQSLAGPAILFGAFSRAPNVFSPELRDCYDYHLLPNMHRKPGESALFLHDEVLVLDYALKSPLPAECPVREQTMGRAYIDPSSMQIVRLEQQRPRHDEGTKLPVSWSWYIDYARVVMDGKPFWLPKTISSKASSLDGGRYKWSFLANYSNYHLISVSSSILPAANTSPQ